MLVCLSFSEIIFVELALELQLLFESDLTVFLLLPFNLGPDGALLRNSEGWRLSSSTFCFFVSSFWRSGAGMCRFLLEYSEF